MSGFLPMNIRCGTSKELIFPQTCDILTVFQKEQKGREIMTHEERDTCLNIANNLKKTAIPLTFRNRSQSAR